MPAFMIVVFIVFISLWIISRVFAWLLQWYLKRLLDADVKIVKVGLFSFKNIHLTFNQGITVQIENLWLSSAYVNQKIKRPLAVCLSDVRIQTPVPTNQQTCAENGPISQQHVDRGSEAGSYDDDEDDDEDDDKDEGEEESVQRQESLEDEQKKDTKSGMIFEQIQPLIATAMNYLQYIGFHSENVTFVLLRSFSPEYLILLKTDVIALNFTLHYESYQAQLQVDTSCCKALKTTSEDGTTSQCQAELHGALHIDASLNRHDPIGLQTLQVHIEKPNLLLTEGFMNDFQCNWRDTVRQQKKMEGHESRDAYELLKILPSKGTNFTLSDLQVEIVRETKQRTVNVSLTSMNVCVDRETPDDRLYNVTTLVTLDDFSTQSTQVKFAALNSFSFKLQLSEKSADVNSELAGLFLHYHHEEVQYWKRVIHGFIQRHTVPGTTHAVHTVAAGQHQALEVTAITNPREAYKLGDRKLRASLTVHDASFMVSTATCTGFCCGIVHTKAILSITPRCNVDVNQQLTPSLPWLQWHDIISELELNTLYGRMADMKVPRSEFSGKRHYWGQMLYVTIFLFKVKKLGQELKVEGMVDNVQMETSTCAQNICLQLLSALTKTTSHVNASNRAAGSSARTWRDIVTSDVILTITVNTTNLNVFVCYDEKVYCMLRVDSISCDTLLKHLICNISGVCLVQASQTGKCCLIHKSHDIPNTIAAAHAIRLKYNIIKHELNIQLAKDVHATWSTRLHMVLYSALQDLRDIMRRVNGESGGLSGVQASNGSLDLSINVIVAGSINLGATLSQSHRISVVSEGLCLSSSEFVCVELEKLTFVCDDHNIFTFTSVIINNDSNPYLTSDRASFTDLVLPTNKSWSVSANNITVVFPYRYKFCDCFEEMSNVWKWLKLVHKITRSPFTIDRPLPPDLQFTITELLLKLCDDPFEVMLGDNYELMKDEWEENEKRRQVLDGKMESQKQRYGILPADKVAEVYESLARRTAEIYIQRSKKLYQDEAMRTTLFTWTTQNVMVNVLADLSMHGTDNCLHHLTQIDPQSPIPNDGLDFVTLWCRMVKLNLDSTMVTLRDYPQPLLKVKDFHVWGRLLVGEQVAAKQALRDVVVDVGDPWGRTTVTRMMAPLKFYHDFSCDVTSMSVTYGPCWEPAMAQFNKSIDYINKPSVDPSHPMPWWDRSRLKYHGRLTMSVRRFSHLYHASLDPYNTSELMDWTWTKFLLDWTNCKFILKGDLDIYARTASKYDDCRLLHLPHLKICVRLKWICFGDPKDHHSVMPCSPNKVPEYSLKEHDSYRSFRSQNVNLNISMETVVVNAKRDDIPCCLFYASTLRFMDKIKMCLAKVSRPIRKGALFDNIKQQKLLLSRHYKHISLSVDLPHLNFCYWMSFAKQHGIEISTDSVRLQSKYELTLTPPTENVDVSSRDVANWHIRYINCEVMDAVIYLCSSTTDTQSFDQNLSSKNPVDRSFFISVTRVTYHRADEDELMMLDTQTDEMPVVHRVLVSDMRGAWTRGNRDVLFGLYEGYAKSVSLKRNLSSDALKGFKVDNTNLNQSKSRNVSITGSSSADVLSPTTQTKPMSCHVNSMLQKLVEETDSKSVAFTEEPSSSNMDQLHGVAVCQTDTVTRKNWLIELENCQVMVRGVETAGYAIISAASAQIVSYLHLPLWWGNQLRSKTTWVGSFDCMQYYATVDPHATQNQESVWLPRENIEDHTDCDVDSITEMVGPGQSVGGVVNVHIQSQDPYGAHVQLQRIISRCKCQIFYAHYGEVDPDSTPNVPLPPADDSDMLVKDEGADSFTLLHHDLNVCTNPLQYAMIMDIVNNLLLYVEPKKKAASDREQSMKFQLLLSREEDQRNPILQLQEKLRLKQVQRLRQLERELYFINKDIDDNDLESVNNLKEDVEVKVNNCKEIVNILDNELSTRISCYKDSQVQAKSQKKATKSLVSPATRINEVCFKFAQWRLTERDGQLGLADLTLRNFVYSKINCENDTWSHQLELGWVKVTNLLPNSIYMDVLVPRDPLNKDAKQMTLRILCSERPPVGGIPVKEHLEVNVVPLQIQMTYHFYKTIMKFFFPDKNIETEDGRSFDEEGEQVTKKKKQKSGKKSTFFVGISSIDKMKERAAENKTFVYIKVPEVVLRVSYKGEKEKNIEDVHDFNFVVPTLEYHSCIWTWFDLLMNIKADCLRVLISQAVKQKLHLKSRAGVDMPVTDVQQEDDKAKMLLGAKLLAGQEKPMKKSLFGKLQK